MERQHRKFIVMEKGQKRSQPVVLIGEEPLSIRVQGSPYAVVMRTPGDEKAHVAGFCLGEGIVDDPDEIVNISFCDDDQTNVATVTLTADRRAKIAVHLDRRTYISQTSCGICGKSIVDDLVQAVTPMDNDDVLDGNAALSALLSLDQYQPLRSRTRSAHAAATYDRDIRQMSVAEDVGRHNALDKAIGRLFLGQELEKARLLTISSRISYEMVQKAARARIPVVLALSRPTVLSVELATGLNMTLAALEKDGSLIVYCNPHRLEWID